MAKRIKKELPATFVAASGDGWLIEFDRHGHDYVARDAETFGVIGYAKTEREARTLVNDYRYEQLRRLA